MTWFNDDMRRDPFAVYREMRQTSPVLHFAPADLWMLFDHDNVKRALTDHESFSSNVAPSRNVRFEWLLFMDPPRHTQLRAIVSKAFTPRSVSDLEPRIRQLAGALLDGCMDRGEMDVAHDLAVPLPMMVMAEMIGIPLDEWPRLKSWSDAIVNLGATIVGTPEAASAASEAFTVANLEMQSFFGALLEERRGAPQNDLITRLAQAEVEGSRLSEEEILRFLQLLLAAGTETTTNLIDNAMICFAEHPAELARVQAAPALLPSAIEEVLRYRSPVQAMFRVTRRDVELGDKLIPAGKFVLAVIGSANRDPRQFVAPDRFDVGRDPNAHLSFGHGIHFCLGAPLSRLEGRAALSDLLSRVDHFELTEKLWQPRAAFQVHGPVRLPIRLSLREDQRMAPAVSTRM
jgi:cytochrome P450